jgi:hypothetical protein
MACDEIPQVPEEPQEIALEELQETPSEESQEVLLEESEETPAETEEN